MKWEYRVQRIENIDHIEQMNERGLEEWELVTVVPGDIAFYKRPVGGIDEQRRLAEKQQIAERNLKVAKTENRSG